MPTATDYSQAIQNLSVAVDDEELKAGEVAVNPMGLPLQYSGNFAVVFQVHCPQTQKTWAVKCFTKQVDRRAERYDAISQHLRQVKLPFMVGFQYQEKGILVGGRWHPIVKMDWVEGEALNRFVAANVDKPRTLRQLLGLWLKLAERLRAAEVTHADLQHGNVLLVPAKDREGHRLMLVDYDGMHVPALALQPSGELGHPAYQHPERLRDGVYSAEVDRFSHLAIYCAIRCLMAGGRRLWERFDNGDNLLFRESDFAKPDESQMLHRLWAARDEDLRALVGHLIHATQTPLDQVPWLPELVSDADVRPLKPSVRERLTRLMGNRYSTHAASKGQQEAGVAGAVRARTVDDGPPKDDLGFVDDMLSEWAAQNQQELERDMTARGQRARRQTDAAPLQAPSPRLAHAKPRRAPPAHQVSAFLEHRRRLGVCWFCQTLPPDDSTNCEVPMHGNVQRTWIQDGIRITWKTVTVKVPRCQTCKAAHDNADALIAIIGCLPGVVAAILAAIVAGAGGAEAGAVVGAAFVALLLIGAVGSGIGAAAGQSNLKAHGIRPKSAKNEFTVVKEMQRKGWQLGERPSTTS